MLGHLPVRVIGIGSPHGDDQIGWRSAIHLRDSMVFQEAYGDQIEISICRTPLDGFLDYAKASCAVIVLDAVISGSPVGTVMRIEEETLPDISLPYSSHGYSVAQMIELGRSMNALPEHIVVLGVEVASCEPNNAPMGGGVSRILQRMEELVIEELEYLAMVNG